MIKVYYRGSSVFSRRAFSWFEKNNINVQKQQISKVTSGCLIKLLQHFDKRLTAILKHEGKSSSEVENTPKHETSFLQ